jgi:hypothetical protein
LSPAAGIITTGASGFFRTIIIEAPYGRRAEAFLF